VPIVTLVMAVTMVSKFDAFFNLPDGSHGEVECLLAVTSLIRAGGPQLFTRLLQMSERRFHSRLRLCRRHSHPEAAQHYSEQTDPDKRSDISSIHFDSPYCSAARRALSTPGRCGN
jgi:hypothetical protein